MIYIVNEANALLDAASLSETKPRPFETFLPAHRGGRWAFLRDLAVFIGLLPQVESQAIHGRWLSLSALREINAGLLIAEDLTNCHSELQTGRLRWLHYLAQAAGLIALQAGSLQPSLEAWSWLEAPAREQWEALMQAVERDLAARERLWDCFSFPEMDGFSWQVLRHTLDDLNPAQGYRAKDVLEMLKPYLLRQNSYDAQNLLAVVRGLAAQARTYFHSPQRFCRKTRLQPKPNPVG